MNYNEVVFIKNVSFDETQNVSRIFLFKKY